MAKMKLKKVVKYPDGTDKLQGRQGMVNKLDVGLTEVPYAETMKTGVGQRSLLKPGQPGYEAELAKRKANILAQQQAAKTEVLTGAANPLLQKNRLNTLTDLRKGAGGNSITPTTKNFLNINEAQQQAIIDAENTNPNINKKSALTARDSSLLKKGAKKMKLAGKGMKKC